LRPCLRIWRLKNWSLIYPDRRTPKLSPAYDFVATTPFIPADRLALSFGGSRSIHEVTRDQIRRFADAAGLAISPLWTIAVETSEKMLRGWANLAEKHLLPAEIRTAVDEQITEVAATILG
jgi:serine/threonine-protein kinase HipA